jgi:hypothetical protein
MQSFSLSRYLVLALCGTTLGGCGSGGSSTIRDAALDEPTGTGGTPSSTSEAGSGGIGTSGVGGIGGGGTTAGTGGTAGGGGVTGGRPGTGGLATGGTQPGTGGGIGGAATAGSPGAGGLGAGGTKPGMGGTTGLGGARNGGSQGTGGQGTGGALPGTGGSPGLGGAKNGGSQGTGGLGTGGILPGTGGTTGLGGAGNGGSQGTGGLGTGGILPGTGGTMGLGGAGNGGSQGTGGQGTGGQGTGGMLPGTGGGTSPRVCPTSASYVGDSTWPDKLVVTAGARYCGHFKETRNLEQEYAAKAMLTLAPGTYSLPSTAGTYDFALPVCFERRPGESLPAFAGAGRVKAVPYKSTTTTYAANGLSATQPIAWDGSVGWVFSMNLSYFSWTGTPQPPVLDGSVLSHPSSGMVGDTNPGYLDYLELCQGTACDDLLQDVRFEACAPDYPLYRHTVAVAGGQVVLDLRITGSVGAAFMLSAFVSASGTLNGSAFAQTDYWKLIYSADHHHFVRNFAVLFDAPIAGACGIKLLDFYGNGGGTPEVYTISCDLSAIAALAVTSATIERL